MSAPARAGTGATSSPLPVGTVVGGRFRIQSFVRTESGSDLYQAIDSQGGGAVRLRLLSEAPPVRSVLDTDLARVARIQHKNLTALLAAGDYAGMLFVAQEAEDGHTLRELVDAQRSQGLTIGVAYAATLLGHVSHGLERAHQALAHGGLSPACVWITRGGRVKVSDLGVNRGLPALGRRGSPQGALEGLYVAPEIARGAPPTPASDVYSLGAVLYELVTGVPPAPPLRPPSQAAKDVPAAVDAVIARAMAPQPHGRFATPGELVNALTAASSATAAPAGSTSSPGAPRITLGKSFDVAQASGMAENDERWLIQKDRLDYGPFSLAQLMAQIERGAFKAEHTIVDVETGERQKIKDHPLLGEFALDADRRLEQVRRAQAEHVHEKVERKKSRATLVILMGAGLVVAAGLAVYLIARPAAQEDELAERIGEGDVEEFLKNVKVDFPSRKKPGGAKRAGGGGRAEDFNNNSNLGDVTQGGGDDILSNDKVQSVMMGNYRKLVPCIMQERHKNAGLSDVDIEFVVLGSGKVSAVKVNGQQSGSFPGCVLGRMQSFNFPSFNGRKTIASWSMSMR